MRRDSGNDKIFIRSGLGKRLRRDDGVREEYARQEEVVIALG
jgi:hypothetical protein